MLTVAIPKRNKLQNIIVLTPKDGLFAFEDAVDGISRKMVRRHPKIFGGDLPETDGNEGDLWERIKRAEKAKNHKTT